MAVISSSVGLFTIPTAPSVGTTVATTVANTFSTTYVTLQTSGVLGALFIPKISVVATSSLKPTYCNVQIATGASGSESIVGQIQLSGFNTPAAAAGIIQGESVDIWPPIAVAANVRIALKTASNAIISWSVSAQAILQANVIAETTINEIANVTQFGGTNLTSAAGIPEVKVNNIAANAITAASIDADAITDAKVASDVTIASVTGAVGSVTGAVGSVTGAVGSVTGAVGSVTGNVSGNVVGSVGSVTGLTASNLDAAITSRMATYTQPTGFLSATFPSSVASPTNITAGTITTVSGNVSGSVGSVAAGGIAAASFAAGAIDASAIATNAIGSDELAASAITEIQSGLSTLTAAGIRTAVGLASANLDTQLAPIAVTSDLDALNSTIGTAAALDRLKYIGSL